MAYKFDIIIIGTGAGGGTLLKKLALSGKRILVVEKGDFIPKEKENWDTEEVFVKARYKTKEKWYDSEGRAFHSNQHYCVGGNTKVYGATLFRLREKDFEAIDHKDGISPAWPIRYEDVKDYYQEAEELYHVHGTRHTDPTEPTESRPYLHQAIAHEPRIQKLYDDLTAQGLHPFPLPLGLKQDRTVQNKSHLILDRFDGFPDPTETKADAHVIGVQPSMFYPNVTLWRNTTVTKLVTNKKGDTIQEVKLSRKGKEITVSATIVCLCAGAINSAALLLASTSSNYPNGVANSSGLVGRNYMCQHTTALVALSKEPNPTKFGKTFAVNDYYFGSDDFQYPMGQFQMLGKSDATLFKEEVASFTNGVTLGCIATHALDFWITTEDLPSSENRIEIKDNKLIIHYKPNNLEAHERLIQKVKEAAERAGCEKHWLSNHMYMGTQHSIAGMAHQCGTLVMGTDPKTSVLNEWCRSHDVTNLYVVDGSFFPSSAAVPPALTIMAMALRVGGYINNQLMNTPI